MAPNLRTVTRNPSAATWCTNSNPMNPPPHVTRTCFLSTNSGPPGLMGMMILSSYRQIGVERSFLFTSPDLYCRTFSPVWKTSCAVPTAI